MNASEIKELADQWAKTHQGHPEGLVGFPLGFVNDLLDKSKAPSGIVVRASKWLGKHFWGNKVAYGVVASIVLAVWPKIFPNDPPPSQEKIEAVIGDSKKALDKLQALEKTVGELPKTEPAPLILVPVPKAPPVVVPPVMPVPAATEKVAPPVVRVAPAEPFRFKDTP